MVSNARPSVEAVIPDTLLPKQQLGSTEAACDPRQQRRIMHQVGAQRGNTIHHLQLGWSAVFGTDLDLWQAAPGCQSPPWPHPIPLMVPTPIIEVIGPCPWGDTSQRAKTPNLPKLCHSKTAYNAKTEYDYDYDND